VAHGLNHEVERALECAQQALALAQRVGGSKLVAFEMSFIASLHLERDKPREALSFARDALVIFQDVKHPRGWTSAAEALMVEALLAREEEARAVEVALRALERCQEAGDPREEVFAQATLAHAHLANEEPWEAMKAAEAALDICQDFSDKTWEAMAMLTVAQVHCDKRDINAAKRSVQAAVEVFQEEEDRHHEAVTSTLLSAMLLMQGEADDALAAAEKGRDLFRDIEETDQEEVALLAASHVHAARGDFEQAIAAAEEVRSIAQETGHSKGEAQALYLLSEWHRANGELEKAMSSAKEMRKIYQVLRSFRQEAYALRQIALLHLGGGEARLAVKAAEAAQKICQRERHQRGSVHMLIVACEAQLQLLVEASSPYGLADAKALKALGEISGRALRAARDAIAVAERAGRLQLRGAAHFWHGRVLYTLGTAEEALAAANTARDLFRQAEDRQGEGQALVLIAQASFQLEGGRPGAEQAAREAMSIFQESGDQEGLAILLQVTQMIGLDIGTGRMLPAQQVAVEAQPEEPSPPPPQQPAAASVVVEKPKGLDKRMVTEAVQDMARAAIGLDEAIYLDSPLMDSGMDSLTAVSFRNGLVQNFGVKLPASLMFDYPSMREVTDRIVEISLRNA